MFWTQTYQLTAQTDPIQTGIDVRDTNTTQMVPSPPGVSSNLMLPAPAWGAVCSPEGTMEKCFPAPEWGFSLFAHERLVVSKQLQLTDILISNALVFLLLSQPAGRRGMDFPHGPYKERPSQGTRLTGDPTSLLETRVKSWNSQRGLIRPELLTVVSLRSHGMCSPNSQAEGEGGNGSAMDKAGQGASGVAGGKFSAWEQNAWAEPNPAAKTAATQRRGGRRELPAWMLCCINGLEMSRDSSGRGDTEGTLAPAHIMRIVKEFQPQKRAFILVLYFLLFVSRKLPFVKLNLQEDFRVPALLMPLLNSRQQYPESLRTLKANRYQIP